MPTELYDQELDFYWTEHVDRESSGEASREVEWFAPSFSCDRELPTKRHSFIVGLGGVFDFWGTSRLWRGTTFYRIRELPPNRANALAIYGDWCAVGGDMHDAVREFERTELGRVPLDPR
jgi:hypothetical protein